MAGRGDDHHLLEVQAVIGLVEETALVSARLDLPSPVQRVLGVQKTVLVDRCSVLPGRVLVQGRVRTSLDLPAGGVITFTADLAFSLQIPLPAAAPGDAAQVLRAVVQDSDLLPLGPLPCTAVADRSSVLLQVKVTRTCLWEAPARGRLRPLPGAALPPVTVTARPVQPTRPAYPFAASPPFRALVPAELPAPARPTRPSVRPPSHPPPRQHIP